MFRRYEYTNSIYRKVNKKMEETNKDMKSNYNDKYSIHNKINNDEYEKEIKKILDNDLKLINDCIEEIKKEKNK